VRVAGLAGMEHGVLAIGGCAAAIAVLVSGAGNPPADFTIPWAVLPIPGFLIAFGAAERYQGRFNDKPGWRGRLGTFLDSIHSSLALVLPITIMVSGAPLAAAIAGVFAYRVLAPCLLLPVSLAVLPTLRDMGEHQKGQAQGIASQPSEPALRRAASRNR